MKLLEIVKNFGEIASRVVSLGREEVTYASFSSRHRRNLVIARIIRRETRGVAPEIRQQVREHNFAAGVYDGLDGSGRDLSDDMRRRALEAIPRHPSHIQRSVIITAATQAEGRMLRRLRGERKAAWEEAKAFFLRFR